MRRRTPTTGGIPIGRYLLTLPVAAVAFIGIAVLDERETFLAAWWPARAALAAVEGSGRDSGRAIEAVRTFGAALERAYGLGSPEPLKGVSMAAALRAELAAELSDPRLRPFCAGLALTDLTAVQLEPSGAGGWRVITGETWSGPGEAGRHRLRFRYTLSPEGKGFRIDEMTPVLPEPVREPRR